MLNLQPKDIVAIITIIFIFMLKLKGINGQADAVLAMILGYYFVKRQEKKDNGK